MKLTREQWLTEISDLIVAEIIAPHTAIRDDMALKLSVGFPPGCRPETNKIGVCFSSASSAKGYNEIFINPSIDDSLLVLETLTHELVHAVDDCKSGHKGAFARIARAIGLEGPLTATHGSEELKARLTEYIELFGDIPHASVNYSTRKRQTNRNRKVWCQCGFKFNTSRAQIDHVIDTVGAIVCPACTEIMQFEI